MATILFLLKFLLVTALFFAVMSLLTWLFTRINEPTLSLAQAGRSIAGTHLGRLRFLFVVAVASFVLGVIFPGPALLLDIGQAVEPVRKFLGTIWHGSGATEQHVPKSIDKPTWFWAGISLIYFGTFCLYIVAGVPELLRTAVREASKVRAARVRSAGPTSPGRRSATAELALVAVGTFLGALFAQIWLQKRSKGAGTI